MTQPAPDLTPRTDGRGHDELRPTTIERGFLDYAEGSCLITMGQTRVVCAASVEETVPAWMRGKGQGWVTAEYRMLPRATLTRTPRETTRVGGRTYEIQRLIGRALRSVVDLQLLGERTVWVDCDVLQADGGTRTAAITGAMVALYDALRPGARVTAPAASKASAAPRSRAPASPPVHPVGELLAAVSVGIVGRFPVVDLCYAEDSAADVDMNVVMTESGRFVEIQGTAEREPFHRGALDQLLDLGVRGIRELMAIQRAALGL